MVNSAGISVPARTVGRGGEPFPLDRFELDYALVGDDDAWHPIGAASDVPVVNE